jgi:hypothetical protein
MAAQGAVARTAARPELVAATRRNVGAMWITCVAENTLCYGPTSRLYLCVICLGNLERGDGITFDSCENTHVFRSLCLQKWLGTAPYTPPKTKSGRVAEHKKGRRCPHDSDTILVYDHLIPGVFLGLYYSPGD